MTHGVDGIRRFWPRHIVHHLIMTVCFLGLVLTGMPQKFPAHTWAKGLVLLFGGVERIRWVHHVLGTLMALQLVWHVVETGWFHLVRRLPMPMLPKLADISEFYQQVRFNLGMQEHPPRGDRYTFAEKLEYLALVWGTVLMVATGVVLLYPVRWTGLISGELVLAAKAAHGGEAILAFLSILTWHLYFVHVRYWNKSIFNGYLEEEAYAEEHPLELARLRRDEVPRPTPAAGWRLALFVMLTGAVALAVLLFTWWLRNMPVAIVTSNP